MRCDRCRRLPVGLVCGASLAGVVTVLLALALIRPSVSHAQALSGSRQHSRAAVSQPERYALLIATGKDLPKDPTAGPLKAPQNDVILAALLLSMRFNFPPEQIYIVGLEAPGRKELQPFGAFQFGPTHADRAAILAGFGVLHGWVKSPRATAVLYYSGHGTTILSLDKTESRKDAFDDEALVPDGTRKPKDLVLDNEIAEFFAALPTRNTLLIADCCFAGGMPMVAGETTAFPVEGFKDWRVVSPPTAGGLARSEARRYTQQDLQRAGTPVLAACLFDERASSQYWGEGGPAFSPFTLALCRTLWRMPGTVTWDRLLSGTSSVDAAPGVCALTGLLGGRGQNPVGFYPGNHRGAFLVSTPAFSPQAFLSDSRRAGRPLPVGRFVLEGISGRTPRVPASQVLFPDLDANPHVRVGWHHIDWR